MSRHVSCFPRFHGSGSAESGSPIGLEPCSRASNCRALSSTSKRIFVVVGTAGVAGGGGGGCHGGVSSPRGTLTSPGAAPMRHAMTKAPASNTMFCKRTTRLPAGRAPCRSSRRAPPGDCIENERGEAQKNERWSREKREQEKRPSRSEMVQNEFNRGFAMCDPYIVVNTRKARAIESSMSQHVLAPARRSRKEMESRKQCKALRHSSKKENERKRFERQND